MQEQKWYIKGMVCQRCVTAVQQAMEELGIAASSLQLGELTISHSEPVVLSLLEEQLQSLGFSVLKEKNSRTVQEIKALVSHVYSGNFDFPPAFRFSRYAATSLNTSYETLSDLFTRTEQHSLEKYIIEHRIRQASEMLVYTNCSVSDIAFALGFSSVAHLSKQFTQHRGLTPSHFRNIRNAKQNARPAEGIPEII
ncbi:MAG: helix-turn-helix domain-containing protein [Bacteroidetes bacterium]|nr:helix-turn-helix domain-containing protein [Bacteroidota bacterium]